MILNSHYPALYYTVHTLPPHGSHVNEINLKTVMELRGNDGLPCPFPRRHSWLLLHAHVVIIAVNLAQFIRGAIKNWLGYHIFFVYSQMTKSAMHLMYHIKDGKHVEYNASSVFVNQNLLGGSVQRFALLNGEYFT